MRNSYVYVLALLSPVLLFAQGTSSTPSDQKCTLSGHVNSAVDGTPLSKAELHLRPVSVPGKPGAQTVSSYLAISNPDGSFQFLSLEPGSYRLSAEATGFLDASYGATRRGQAGSLITLKAGQQLTDVKMALAPQAVISGKLVDEDGDPTTADDVQVFHQTWVNGKLTYRLASTGNVDDRGYFRASGLSAGKYIVCAQVRPDRDNKNEIPSGGKPPVGPVSTCYPSATSIDTATPIHLQSGQELDGIEIHVRSVRTFHVRGTVTGALPSGDSREQMQLTLAPEETGSMFFGGGTRIAKNGSFDIPNVGPGAYVLSLYSVAEGPFSGLATVPVTVTSADVNGIVLTVTPPGELHGTVRVEGTAASGGDQWTPERVRVWLVTENRNYYFGPPSQGSAKADGSLVFEKVAAAKYRINISGTPNGGYLAALRYNNQDLSDKTIDLSQGTGGELEIVFRYGAAEIDGTVQVTQNSASQAGAAGPAPSASIVLIPDSGSGMLDGMKFGSIDQNGKFSFKGVAPGTYHVFALEQAAQGPMQNPAVVKALLDRGTEVEVNENDKKQLQVSLISEDDFRQVLSGLGIDEE